MPLLNPWLLKNQGETSFGRIRSSVKAISNQNDLGGGGMRDKKESRKASQ